MSNGMSRGDLVIRASTAATVVGIGGIAAVVSFRHALEVVRENGETGVTAYLTPLTVDGLVFTASMVLLDAARRGDRAPMLARVALGLGIAATVAVNVLHGLAHGPIGAVVGAWPAVTLILVVELLMGMIRRGRQSAKGSEPAKVASGQSAPKPRRTTVPSEHATDRQPVPAVPGKALVPVPAEVRPASDLEPAEVRAMTVFADDIKAGQVPSIRRIKATLRCGQAKATQVRAHLSSLAVREEAAS
ncbi:DUF2637 domain-containing protein [Actinomadura sp. SCN-SB]|uniref:DUF2637 domain-containing protein n=1 Tax=Actinomadura sp. SCN-SB TaxID=3373092 RepID=UPI0037523734